MVSKKRIGNAFLSSIYLCFFFILVLSITNIARASDTSDLIIKDITWTPTNPSLGETVTFTATIKNQGNGSSSSSRVYFYFDGSTRPLKFHLHGMHKLVHIHSKQWWIKIIQLLKVMKQIMKKI